MNNTGHEVLLLRGADDEYYALPRRIVERYRVPTEHRATIPGLRQRLRSTLMLRAGYASLFGTFGPKQPVIVDKLLRDPPLALGWIDLGDGAPGDTAAP